MNTHLYFAYGMNTNVAEMAKRCPRAVSHGRAQLLDHVFRFAGPADVVKCSDSYVDGVLWTITDDCLKSLDILEGYPDYYLRNPKRVWFDGRVVMATTYYMRPGNLNCRPSQGYFDTVLEGYRAHKVCTEQLYNALAVQTVLTEYY